MANGRVITGFSKPFVALYSASGTTVTYTGGIPLARGVEVQIEPETTDDNRFYADNIVAENEAGTFNGGTATITVDGLKDAANKLIFGLPTADQQGWTNYGNDQAVPYVGFGCVVRFQEEGVVSYVPLVLTKIQFNEATMQAATQEDTIDWQTQELTAQVFRDDSANQVWKKLGAGVDTEAAAETAMKAALGVS